MASKEEKFKNEPSRNLYKALTQLIDAKRLTAKDVATKFGQYEATPRNYFNAISSAKISVTVDQILKAQEFFGIDPCKLFTASKNQKENKKPESDEPNDFDEADVKQKDLVRIIEKQQETIHFLVTGKNPGSKKAS